MQKYLENGEIWDWNYENLLDTIQGYFDTEVATKPFYSPDEMQWFSEGMNTIYIDGESYAATFDNLEWIMEEHLNIYPATEEELNKYQSEENYYRYINELEGWQQYTTA